MGRALLGLALLAVVGALLAGCEPKPSVQIAPDVKQPDTSGMTTEQVLKLKNGQGSGDTAANVAPR